MSTAYRSEFRYYQCNYEPLQYHCIIVSPPAFNTTPCIPHTTVAFPLFSHPITLLISSSVISPHSSSIPFSSHAVPISSLSPSNSSLKSSFHLFFASPISVNNLPSFALIPVVSPPVFCFSLTFFQNALRFSRKLFCIYFPHLTQSASFASLTTRFASLFAFIMPCMNVIHPSAIYTACTVFVYVAKSKTWTPITHALTCMITVYGEIGNVPIPLLQWVPHRWSHWSV